MLPSDHEAVAGLIHHSTNAWYQENRGFPIFTGGPEDCLLFPEVYGDLDPGEGIVAEDGEGRIVGSAFLHPRPTHIAIGIVNTHPEAAGSGVASKMMGVAIEQSEESGLPLRLVSSAMNLDSFSLYSRIGFRPLAIFQDMSVTVPGSGVPVPGHAGSIRPAQPDDVPVIVDLERRLSGIERPGDYACFAENRAGIWSLLVLESPGGGIDGCLASVHHPASHMLGPGIAVDENVAFALLCAQLDSHRGRAPVFLLPSDRPALVARAYALGARNCELHFLQVRGEGAASQGISFPTFMPETG